MSKAAEAEKMAGGGEEVWVQERRVMGRVRLNRNECRYLRQRYLEKGRHWKVEGGKVWLSAAGVAVMEEKGRLVTREEAEEWARARAVSAAPRGFLDPARLLCWPEKGPARPRRVWVVRGAGIPNRRVLLALGRPLEAGHAPVLSECVTVSVRDNERFVRGMEILAVPPACEPGLWTFAGNPKNPEAGARMPRGRGIW